MRGARNDARNLSPTKCDGRTRDSSSRPPLLATTSHAKLVAAAVLPHGDFAFDPSLLWDSTARAQANKLHAGCAAAGKFLAASKPDVIVLSTPHGLQATWNLAAYDNPDYDGVATVGRDLDESYKKPFPEKLYTTRLKAKADTTLARRIASLHDNVTLIRGWNGVLPLPLHWGELLALGFVANASSSTNTSSLAPKLVTLGLPLSRYNFSSLVAPGFRTLGRELGALLEAEPYRIALLVSTDLAHTHWANTTFGFNPYAQPFDEAVGQWAATLDPTALFVTSAKHVDKIYSCGWLGMVLLHGALEAASSSSSSSSAGLTTSPLNASWRPQLTAAPAHPTYYGMMAATFERRVYSPMAPSPSSPKALQPSFDCPAKNHKCQSGCTPVEAGNATCCTDGTTACPEGYQCTSSGPHGVACTQTKRASATTPQAKPLPAGTAGWSPRYNLCHPASLQVYNLPLPLFFAALNFPYYSNGGSIESPTSQAQQAEIAFIVQHGSSRNADDYFCSGVQAAEMAGYGNGKALVLAPRFMELKDKPSNGTIWWNGSYPEGCWRCGAESDPRASGGFGSYTVSSFGVLDTMIRALAASVESGALPNLKRVVLAGHSSGGQIIQRHAIFTRLPLPNKPLPFHVRHVPANPSSYAYLTPKRWKGLVAGSSDRLALPNASMQQSVRLMTIGTLGYLHGSSVRARCAWRCPIGHQQIL